MSKVRHHNRSKETQSLEPFNFSYHDTDKSEAKVRIYELCQDDKNRIGELINKLVTERHLKDHLCTR